jgi:two-component system sensor histidine kinase KdpD
LSSIEGALSNLRQQLYPLATTEAVSSTALHQELIDALHVIENSSKELGKTLATITAMTQFSEGLLPLNKSMGNIHDVLNECCENFKKAATHIIDLQVDGSLPPAYFDFYLLEVLFLNLLNFVRDHTSKGSTIAIAATKSNDYFIITIASQGPAIPAKDLRAIFEPLYQPIDPTLNAIAPELAICKTIAEIHDGYLSVENIPPDMTKFSVFLPLEG